MNKLLKNLKFRLVAHLCSAYIRLVGLTSKIRFVKQDIVRNLIKNKTPFIFAFWHNRQFFLGYPKMHNGVSVLVSQSEDGEFIARAIHYLGIKTIRGSSTRGGVRALAEMIRTVKKGGILGITPDGPRGPIFEVQPGVIHIAQKTQAPIVPICCSYARKKIFRSWDLYQIPFPFNNIAIGYGNPIYISEKETLEKASQILKRALDDLTSETDRLVNSEQ